MYASVLTAATALQDIFTLFWLDRSFKFVSKTSNFLIPIVGWSMFLTGRACKHLFVLPFSFRSFFQRLLARCQCKQQRFNC